MAHTPNKFVAQRAPMFQAPNAMTRRACSDRLARAVVAAFVSAAFLWALGLSVSPQLHARIHADSNRAEHSCAATLIATGSYDHGAPPPLLPQPQFSHPVWNVVAVCSTWVRPLFLRSHIFAHAPPAFS
jgi:hypothetical protein